jgi:hypothetical protein
MPRPRLQLVHSSNGTQPGADRRLRTRGFRPSVIQGSGRAKSAPGEISWDAPLKLMNFGVLASCRNYMAFLQLSMAVLEAAIEPILKDEPLTSSSTRRLVELKPPPAP